MEVEENFVHIAGLICEPSRARMLWNLLDGRSYTATELAACADVSATAASNHLAKLLEAELVKVEIRGRHRYYSFASSEIAYVVESLANLSGRKPAAKSDKRSNLQGIKRCRTCYDHLAGFVGVEITEALERKSCLQKNGIAYLVTEQGWQWFAGVGISVNDFADSRRPLTRQCLDWSERRPHLAGHLGATLLKTLLQMKWFEKIQFSRELTVTAAGQKSLNKLLNIRL
jgi:DNA-binding transcriptional ArsR family regulator